MDSRVSSKASRASGTVVEDLAAVVSAGNVRAAGILDTVAGVHPRAVAEPADEGELAAALKFADGAGLAVIPRGGGTKLEWGNAPKRADIILSTARLDAVVEHAWADLTVTVEAGCTVQKLQDAVARHGQRLAFDTLWPERATVGGVLSTNESGALRLRFGSLRDLVIGATLALADGTLARSGGKVVKNVAGYDLQKLATGALGTLGVITRATFRLHPLPRHSRTLTISPADLREAQRILLAIQDSKLAHTALQLRIAGGDAHSPRSAAASGAASDNAATPYAEGAPRLEVLLEGTEAGVGAQATQLAKLATPARIEEAGPTAWKAREELFSDASRDAGASSRFTSSGRDSSSASFRGGDFAVAKIVVLPASIASTLRNVDAMCAKPAISWRAVVQATGVGWLRLEGNAGPLAVALASLREEIEREGGSVVVAIRSAALSTVEAWGIVGDALALMRAVKLQFDPAGTLNPGRFAGGI